MVCSLAVGIVSVVWIMNQDRRDTLTLTAKPNWLLGIVIVSVVTMAARFFIAIDAARAAGLKRTKHRRLSYIGLIVVLLIVALPHVVAATLAWQQRSLVNRVFTAERTVTAQPTLIADAPPQISSEHVDDIDAAFQPARPKPAAEAIPAPITEPEPEVDPIPDIPETTEAWDGEDRLSIVMLGSDGGYDRSGIRTDTIIVLSIEVATGDAITFSVPRNWEHIPFPANTPAAAAYPNGNPDLANTIYALGKRRPDLFAESDHPGGAAVKEAMAQTLGIPIHYFVMVDMTSVVETIDLFGGIDLTVTEYINDRIRPIEKGGPYLDINVHPGKHHFDGLTTLAYVRSRVQSWDYSRMARQRCVVAALIDQVSPLEVLTAFGPFSDIVANHVVTDIPLDRADELLGVAARMSPARMQSVNFVPPEFRSGRVPLTKVRSAVESALTTDVAVDPSHSMTAACGAG